MCFIGAGIGFAGCLMNPFTLGIAQEIAGLQLFSGLEYRFIIWLVINIVGIGYVLWYANRVKKNPTKSIVYHEDSYWREHHAKADLQVSEKSLTSTWVAYVGAVSYTHLDVYKRQAWWYCRHHLSTTGLMNSGGLPPGCGYTCTWELPGQQVPAFSGNMILCSLHTVH